MKKIILSVVAAAICMSASAQIHFGVKAGMGFSNINNAVTDLGFTAPVHIGYNFGVVGVGETPIDNLCGRIEVMYSEQGHDLKFDGDRMRYNIGYLTIPVLGQYNLLNDRLHVYTGPNLSFYTNNRLQLSGNGGKYVEQTSSEDISKFVFSWALGASFMVTENIAIDFRYNFGLSKTYSDKNVTNLLGTSLNVGQLGVIYYFL